MYSAPIVRLLHPHLDTLSVGAATALVRLQHAQYD